jgi:L-lactate dehydrogenase complex protein LldE
VGPAGSCVKQIRVHYDNLEQTDDVKHVRENTYELVEFLYDILSCNSIRGLGIAKPSERMGEPFNKSADLLKMVEGVELVELNRPDECCGFGGTFCITDEAVSVKMGHDKVADYLANGAEVVVSPDMSCLMHQQAVAHKNGLKDLPFIHIAQVLNGGPY